MSKTVNVIFILLIIVFTGDKASANLVTIEKEYSYQAGELDSKVSSRAIALEQVKRFVLEQVGTYVSSATVVNDYQLTSDQITAITAGIVGAEIEKESWDGKTYFMKAKCTIDPDEVSRTISKVLQDQNQVAELEANEAKMDELLKEVAELKSEVASMGPQERQGQDQGPTQEQEQGPTQGQYQDRYVYAINQVRALDLVQNSWTYYNAGQYQAALDLLNGAQVISPERDPGIHIARSYIYLRMNNRRRSLEELSVAAKLDPKYRQLVYLNRAVYFQQTGDRNRALAEANRALNNNPNYSYAYYQRAMIHRDMGHRNRADQDMRKAAQLGNKKARYYLKQTKYRKQTQNKREK